MIRRVLLCMLVTVDGGLCSLEVPEMMRCVLCMLETVGGGLCLLEVPEVVRCVLYFMLEAVECGLCL